MPARTRARLRVAGLTPDVVWLASVRANGVQGSFNLRRDVL
jgi:hypothetical protein